MEVNKTHPIEPKKPKSNLLSEVLKALAICVLLLFLYNQFLEYRYKQEFLQGPCTLCLRFHPEATQCFLKTIPLNSSFFSVTNITNTSFSLPKQK